MIAPLSIIIPTLNAGNPLLRLLPQLFEGLTEGLIAELIFADGGSTDQTAAIAEDAGAKIISCEQGRGTQLRTGCATAKGRWLLILHADSKLPDDWTEVIREHMDTHPKEAAVFRLTFNDRSFMAGWRMWPLPRSSAAIFAFWMPISQQVPQNTNVTVGSNGARGT